MIARAGRWTTSPSALRRLAVASVVANIVIVVTGGAVRLTASGLGCPTWPTCTGASLVPTARNASHGVIEFTNRMLTFVLVVVAVATLVAAWRQQREKRLALLAFLGIPAQAVLGGITVLTHLNPWTVGAHLLLSMVMIAITATLWWRLNPASTAVIDPAVPGVRLLSALVVAVTAIVLALGTVVTGSGPHAGDADSSGKVHRNGLSPAGTAQLHADSVMVLIGLTIGLVVLVHALRAAPDLRRASAVLLAVELAQGLIGFVQYFTHLPVLLVGIHMFGACLVWFAALHLLLRTTPSSEKPAERVDDQSDQRADHGAVHTDELQVPTDLKLQPPARLG